MAYSKKRLIAAAMAGVLAMMSAFPGYAASKISLRFNIRFNAHICISEH